MSSNKRLRGRGLQSLRKRVFAVYGDECWLCGQEGADTIDHLVMVSQGGSDTITRMKDAAEILPYKLAAKALSEKLKSQT